MALSKLFMMDEEEKNPRDCKWKTVKAFIDEWNIFRKRTDIPASQFQTAYQSFIFNYDIAKSSPNFTGPIGNMTWSP